MWQSVVSYSSFLITDLHGPQAGPDPSTTASVHACLPPHSGQPGSAAGVLGELLPFGRRLSWEVTLWGLAGFLLGFATDLVLAVAGG